MPDEWILKDAVQLISHLNKASPKHHFALAGGVLNNGHSDKDLDIVVLRRGEHTCYEDVWPFLHEQGFKLNACKSTDVWSVWKTSLAGSRVDFLFPCRVADQLRMTDGPQQTQPDVP